MGDGAVIRCRLDLLIRLIDTTTGQAVTGGNAVFRRDGKILAAVPKEGGNYIFIDMGRENFLMQLSVFGYDDKMITVDYENLDTRMPSIDVFLIPSEDTREVLTLSGKRTGLQSIEAVQLGRPVCSISEFDAKQNRVSLFLPNRQMNMEGAHFGLLHGEESYEHFVVSEQPTQNQIKLAQPLQEEFAVNSPVSRVIFGETDAKGNYVLRVRKTAENLRYLLRYQIRDQVKFKVIDLSEGTPEGFKL